MIKGEPSLQRRTHNTSRRDSESLQRRPSNGRKDSLDEHRSKRRRVALREVKLGDRFLFKHQWEYENREYLRDVRTNVDEEYRNYIKKYVEMKADMYFQDKHMFEWFKDQYDYTRLIEARQSRKNTISSLFSELKEAKSDKAKLKSYFPCLDCPQWMLEGDDTEISEVEKFSQVKGFPFDIEKVVLITSLPSSITNEALITEISDIMKTLQPEGEFKVYFSDPFSHQDYHRNAWIMFTVESDSKKLLHLKGCNINNIPIAFGEQKFVFNELISPLFANPKRIKQDYDQALLLAKTLDKEEELEQGIDLFMKDLEEDTIESKEIDAILEQIVTSNIKTKLLEEPDKINSLLTEFLKIKKGLDLAIGYLRQVHLVCYYSGTQYKDQGDMFNHAICPKVRHRLANDSADALIRKLLEEETVENTSKVLTDFDEKISSLLKSASPEEIERRKDLREKDKNKLESLEVEFLDKFVEENTVEEGDNKFRCNLPPRKLFRGKQFVKKHIMAKHPEPMARIKEEARVAFMKVLFMRDDNKPIPSEEFFYEKGSGRRQDRERQNQQKYNRRHDRHRDNKVVIEKVVSAVPEAQTRTVVDYSDL